MFEEDNIIELLNSVESLDLKHQSIPHDLRMSFGGISSSSGGSDPQFEVIELRAQLADAHLEISRRDDCIRDLKKLLSSRSYNISLSTPSVVPPSRHQPSSAKIKSCGESNEIKELRCRAKRAHEIITELRARVTKNQKQTVSLQSAHDSLQEMSLKHQKKTEVLQSMLRNSEHQIRHNLNLHEALLKEHTADALRIRALECDLHDAIKLSSSLNIKVTALKQLCRQLESENIELRQECDRHRNEGFSNYGSIVNPVDRPISFDQSGKKQNFIGLEAIYERVYKQKIRADKDIYGATASHPLPASS